MSASNPPRPDEMIDEDEEDDLLDEDDAAEEIPEDSDHPMEDDDEALDDADEEIQFQNDSVAHFDIHTDSIFCIGQHPVHQSIVLTGGGDDVAYIFDASIPEKPLLPSSYESSPQPRTAREGIKAIQKLDGHTDSVNAVAFTLPKGEYLVTAGLDGKLRAWKGDSATATKWTFVAEAAEVDEINWVAPCPNPQHPNTVAFGGNNGSVWVYTINPQDDPANPLVIVQSFFNHTASCTAGAWSPDGTLLGTVSEDGSFYVWDIFNETTTGATGAAVVSLTAADQRFAIDGGLYSVALTSSIAAVGGADGQIRIVGLPTSSPSSSAAKKSSSKSGPKPKAAASSAGQILASLNAQNDGIETLAFSPTSSSPTGPALLAAGSVDGSIAIFDVAHRFILRRMIREAHDEFAVVKVEFVVNAAPAAPLLLTSAGMDGVVRRWEVRGPSQAEAQAQAQGQQQPWLREWRGHVGGGEKGGVLGFVQPEGRIVTAGDDGVALVFRTD